MNNMNNNVSVTSYDSIIGGPGSLPWTRTKWSVIDAISQASVTFFLKIENLIHKLVKFFYRLRRYECYKIQYGGHYCILYQILMHDDPQILRLQSMCLCLKCIHSKYKENSSSNKETGKLDLFGSLTHITSVRLSCWKVAGHKLWQTSQFIIYLYNIYDQ